MAGSCRGIKLRLAGLLLSWESITNTCCSMYWACPKHEVELLQKEDLIGNTPAGGSPPSTVPLKRQVELGSIVESYPDY